MVLEVAPPLPQTCSSSIWLWPGQALYAGPSLNLAPHSGSVWCLAVGVDRPLTVTAAVDSGFASPSHLADRFKATFGLSATQLLGTGAILRTP
jgi:hypothetical protein